MESRDGKLIVRVTEEEKIKILDAVGDRETTISQLIREALEFYLAFPQAFLEQIGKVAREAKLPLANVIVHLLLKYGADDKAMIDNFGISKTWERAFRFTREGKLIEGDELSDILSNESNETAKELRRKLEQTKRTGKPAKVAGEDIPMILQLMQR